MYKLIKQVTRLLRLAAGGRTPDPSPAEGVNRVSLTGPSRSRADVSNGIRWSDIVADIESKHV